MLNQLKPYLTLIKVGIGVLLLSAAFIGGCEWKENKEETAKLAMQTIIDAQKMQIASISGTLNEINAQALANKKAAEAARMRAETAALEAQLARAKLNREKAAWERKFAAAKTDPNCQELLERKLCPLIDSF